MWAAEWETLGVGRERVGTRPPTPDPLSAAPYMPPQPGRPLRTPVGVQERSLVSQTPSGWGVTSRSSGCKIPRSLVGPWLGRGRGGWGGLCLGIPLPGVLDTCFRSSGRGLPLMLFITFKSSCRLQSFLKLKISPRSWARVPEAGWALRFEGTRGQEGGGSGEGLSSDTGSWLGAVLGRPWLGGP